MSRGLLLATVLWEVPLLAVTVNEIRSPPYYLPVYLSGRFDKGAYRATITQTADSMPEKRVYYLPDRAERDFLQRVMIFPGENSFTVTNGEECDTLKVYPRPLAFKSLKIRLEWSGSNQDYDLHVNGISYASATDGDGQLDHDWKRDGDEGKPIENITYQTTPAGFYSIHVTYYSDHDHSGEEAGRGAVPTRVTIEWDGQVIYNKVRTLRQVGSIWPIGTLVVNAGERIGGCGVDATVATPGIVPHSNLGRTIFRGTQGTRSQYCRVTAFYGSRGERPVYLRLGEAAQFQAYGTLNAGTSEPFNGVELLSVLRASGAGRIDDLGVYHATSTGRAEVCPLADGADKDAPGLSPIEVYVVDPEAWIASDYNRDGELDAKDAALAANGRPLRLWINDDRSDPARDIVNDAKDQRSVDAEKADCKTSSVDGRCDLIDFFPLRFNLCRVLEVLPPETFDYKLVQEDDAVNIVWTKLPVARFNDVYTMDFTESFGEDFTANSWQAPVTPMRSTGVMIPRQVLAFYAANPLCGLAFIEGTVKSRKPLRLQIIPKNEPTTVAYEYMLPLSVSPVEEMFRWLDIRRAAGDSPRASCLDSPVNAPDGETNGKQVVFVHGYNVSREEAGGWGTTMFKRLYRAGSQAMFTAVTWYGNDSRILWTATTPNYYVNALHALESAPALRTAIAALPGEEKTVIAHSLGTLLAAAMITDRDEGALSPVSRYFMLNAALPEEALQAVSFVNTMVPESWRRLQSRTYAADWHRLFPSADSRATLTWRLRLARLRTGDVEVYNFYSSTEDVLRQAPEQGDASLSDHAWVYQEQHKGTAIQYGLLATPCEGGWGKNVGLYQFYSTDRLNQLTDAQLVKDPVFTPFDRDLHVSTNATVTLSEATCNRLLAGAIPALSHAVGSKSAGDAVRGNWDMDAMKALPAPKYKWPSEMNQAPVWKHSAFRELAYPFVYKVFATIVLYADLNELKQRSETL